MKPCPKCNSPAANHKYNSEFDAYYCCGEWTEKKCGYEECTLCPDRPEKPPAPIAQR